MTCINIQAQTKKLDQVIEVLYSEINAMRNASINIENSLDRLSRKEETINQDLPILPINPETFLDKMDCIIRELKLNNDSLNKSVVRLEGLI